MSSASASAAKAMTPQAPQPLISFSIIDAPSQRFYAVAIAGLVQIWKYTRIIASLLYDEDQPARSGSYSAKKVVATHFSLSNAVLINFAVLFVLSRLAIPLLDPRLKASPQATPKTADAKPPVLQPSKTTGLSYLSYTVLFSGLTLLDAVLLANGTANPAVALFNVILTVLRFLSSFIGVALPLTSITPDALTSTLSISEGRVRIRDLIQPKSHILGQHTIHILPHSTAKLSPASACYCIGPQTPQVSIPVLFSNTEPDLLQYSITDFTSGQASYHNVSVDSLILVSPTTQNHEADELNAVAAASDSQSKGSRRHQSISNEDDLDEPGSMLSGVSYGERAKIRADRRARTLNSKGGVKIASTKPIRSGQQLLWHLPVKQPGRIRLERVLDRSRNDARLSTSEALVVTCPSTQFIAPNSAGADFDLTQDRQVCPGDSVDFGVQVRGIPPLELEYRQVWSAAQGRDPRTPREEHSRRISRIAPPHHTSPLLLPESDAAMSPSERMALARERTRSAAKRNQQGKEDYSWAASVAVDLPLSSVVLDQPGNFSYVLEAVQDACGNRVKVETHTPTADLTLKQKARKKITGRDAEIHQQTVNVHSRRTVGFHSDRCRPGLPIPLLRNSDGLDLILQSPDHIAESGNWTIDVSFEPDNSAASKGLWARKPAHASTLQVSMAASSSSEKFTVTSPGLYRIEDVSGPFCSGEVGAPWTCEVIDVPPPTAQINFSSIEDRCAGPVGVKAMSVLTGKPPFQLEYEVQKQGRSPERKVRTIYEQTRDELDFRPDTEGAVTYKFTKLHDSNYKNIELDGPSFTQVFHPLSSAEFTAQVRAYDDRAVIQSCSGKQATADVKLSGAGPWDITYAVRAGDSVETKQVKGISESPHQLNIDIPEQVAKSGGMVTVSLVKIRDSKGCDRSLATRDLNVEVRRVQPNAGFLPVKADKGRSLELLTGKKGRLPLRLSGQGPWQVEYTWQADESAEPTTHSASLQDVNAEIDAEHPGIYRIKSIRDNHCPGVVLKGQEEYRITTRAKPHVQYAPDAGHLSGNGSLVRPAVCQGVPDSVDVIMGGSFPIDVGFEHISPSWSAAAHDQEKSGALTSSGNERAAQGRRKKGAFTSALGVTNLELSTLTPGWHTYLLESVGDAAYAKVPLEGFSTSEPRRLEQMVLPLPGGAFAPLQARNQKSSLCVGDGIEKLTSLPVFKLHGQAPFTVTFEVRSDSDARDVHRFVRSGITTLEYKLELRGDEFKFGRKGSWSIVALHIIDANGCESSPAAEGKISGTQLGIDVAETADIAAVSSREDYCIGETVHFALQGSPPWTVSYDFNGKGAQAALTTAEFSRVAQQPGVFTIKSIAHQQNQCKRDIDPRVSQDMVKTIHALPTVHIREGSHFVEDLREGNQAEIIFMFKGVPPFAFTYQRSEPVDMFKKPKILETNTVSGILESRYSIWASVEGTWSVTWLQDRWCQVSLDYQSGAATPLGKSTLAIKNTPES